MGLALMKVRIGYAAVVLQGGKPYVLQKVGSKGHRFVRECYVHGCMKGEALALGIPEQECAIR